MKPMKFIILLTGLLFFASCRTSRRVHELSDGTLPQQGVADKSDMADVVKQNSSLRFNDGSISSKINLTLNSGDKSMSVGGNLRMKRNDVIQLSLVALGVFEAGRLELTESDILIVDRMGRKYIRIPYNEIDILKENGIGFYTFQSLFWGEAFLLESGKAMPKDNRYEKTLESGMLRLRNTESEQLVLDFLFDAVSKMLLHSTISSQKNPTIPLLDWQYLSYATLKGKQFPSKMQFGFKFSKKPVSATLILNNPKTDDGWETRTEINTRRYKEVPLSEVLSQIMTLSK